MTRQWIKIINVASLPSDDVVAVGARGRELALYTVGGRVYVTDNICTHGHARLCDGFLDGYEIECPLHQGTFDVRTGKALCEPLTENIGTYEVRIEDGDVFVQV
ncbi:non-heme iron oxygenase ferredoxin subunit [Caballeronia sp. KNU42]